jgi:hypothetical protein
MPKPALSLGAERIVILGSAFRGGLYASVLHFSGRLDDPHTVERAVHEDERRQEEPESEYVTQRAAGLSSEFHRQFNRQQAE